MKRFANLYAELDASTSTLAKVAALERYFRAAPLADGAWAAYFLAGGTPRRTVPAPLMRAAACEAAGVAPWLFEECYQAVGDLAETIALLLPEAPVDDDAGLATWVVERLLPLRGMPVHELPAQLIRWWSMLDAHGRLVMNKLITGGFRVGVSRLLVQKALAQAFDVDPRTLAQRMIGYTDVDRVPTADAFAALVADPGGGTTDVAVDGRPYPFFLAQSLQQSPEVLGPVDDWFVEWKWDGIRAQLVRRAGETWLWSRGEELITDRFPELVEAAAALPGALVLDAEVLAWAADGDRPLPFATLQQRIGRKTVSAKVMRDAPTVLMVFDLLELDGEDWRAQPLSARRDRLATLLAASSPALRLSPRVGGDSWPALAALRARSRALGVEGFMLKRLDAVYGIGRTKGSTRGEWWKWKIDPLSIDCVLIYAQRGHGRRASLYTDFTFAVWDEGRLVPFAKAYSGLTDEELRQVDAIVSRTTIEKFGPVRSVTPTQVFELGFEAIQRSPRHKSGIAVRFPRILRWRRDKAIEDADSLATLRALLETPAP